MLILQIKHQFRRFQKRKKNKQKSTCKSQKTLKILQIFCTKNSFFFQFSFCDNVKCLLINSIIFKLQHKIYENMKSLFANLILFLLTIILTNDVFRNYFIFAEIKTISLFHNNQCDDIYTQCTIAFVNISSF